LGQLVLSTTVVDTTNPSNTATLTSSALPSPRTGTYFGYADDGFWGDGGTINYDNFTLSTVPEPASIGLLALGAVGLLARRRQKA
jgi:hypothetical protein